MVTVLAHVTIPKEEAEKFEDRFWRVHLPLVRKFPGLRQLKVHRIVEQFRADKPDLYCVVELEFENREALDKAVNSPEMMASKEDGAGIQKDHSVEMRFRYLCETKKIEPNQNLSVDHRRVQV